MLQHKVTTYLRAFGHDTMKGLTIWSTNKRVRALKRAKPTDYNTLCRKHEKGTTGKPDELKKSQSYPRAFGEAVAQITWDALQEADMHDIEEREVANSLMTMILGTSKPKRVRKKLLKKPVAKRPARA